MNPQQVRMEKSNALTPSAQRRCEAMCTNEGEYVKSRRDAVDNSRLLHPRRVLHLIHDQDRWKRHVAVR